MPVLPVLQPNVYSLPVRNSGARHSVDHYVKAYRQNGLDSLERATPPGKAFRLTVEQRKILKETVAYKTPDEVGFTSHSST
jgi:hypothetical protein